VKRFFSFTYAFPALNHEWTGIMAILNWLKIQLGKFDLDDTMVAQFETQISEAQQADLGAHGRPDDEKAHGHKLATLAKLRKKDNKFPGLGGHDHERPNCPDRRPHDPKVLVDRT